MIPKIFLLTFFLVVMALIPFAKAGAIHTYVGIQVTAASTSNTVGGGTADTSWCLAGSGGSAIAGYGTFMTILGSGSNCDVNSTGSSTTGTCTTLPPITGSNTCNGDTCNGAGVNVGSPVPLCPGGSSILWSGLVDLSVNTKYVIQLYTRNYCPGVYSDKTNADCWVTASANQSCTQVCDNYGLTPFSSSTSCYNDSFSDCGVLQALKGSVCATCTAVSYTGSNYYDASGNCYYTTGGYGWASTCNALGVGITRACYCNSNNYSSNNFYFAFTTPASF